MESILWTLPLARVLVGGPPLTANAGSLLCTCHLESHTSHSLISRQNPWYLIRISPSMDPPSSKGFSWRSSPDCRCCSRHLSQVAAHTCQLSHTATAPSTNCEPFQWLKPTINQLPSSQICHKFKVTHPTTLKLQCQIPQCHRRSLAE